MLKEKLEKGMASQEEITSWKQSLENQVRRQWLRVYNGTGKWRQDDDVNVPVP